MATPTNPKHANTLAGINVDTWTSNATASIPLETSTFAAALAERPIATIRDATGTLEIPLDSEPPKTTTQQRREARALKNRVVSRDDDDSSVDVIGDSANPGRQGTELRRRDSLKRRELLLKGKEGTRRRQKWENDRLLGNPAYQPPEAHDWAPHPTHSVRSVPYVLAPLWDEGYGAASRARAAARQRQVTQQQDAQGQVPRELREKLKRARGARTLLMELEEQVRAFVRQWEEDRVLHQQGWDVNVGASGDFDDFEDIEAEESEEEVVFIGRTEKGKHGRGRGRGDSQGQGQSQHREKENRARTLADVETEAKKHSRKISDESILSMRRDKLVFDAAVEDQGASFGRWLVHSIATYYNLRTWSVTTKDKPARREAYVGIPDARLRKMRRRAKKAAAAAALGDVSGAAALIEPPVIELPRPLWVVV